MNQPLSKSQLARLVISRVTGFLVVMSLLFFIPAGTWSYWQAWMFMGTLLLVATINILYLLKNDPALLERRMRMREREGQQRKIVVAGFLFVLWVFKTNTYTSRIVEVEAGQKVISNGPYVIVRHPMYVGAFLVYAASPLALGSYWAVLPGLMILPVLIFRILDEEKLLLRDLPGYREYTQKVTYRLLPGIW